MIWLRQINLIVRSSLKPGRCGWVVSASACQAGSLWFKSGILPLLKHAYGESNQLLCWLYTPAEVSHQRWISGNIYHVCLHKVRIRQNPLWLWNPEETSPEVRNRRISGPKNGPVSNKNFKKKKKEAVWRFDVFPMRQTVNCCTSWLELKKGKHNKKLTKYVSTNLPDWNGLRSHGIARVFIWMLNEN